MIFTEKEIVLRNGDHCALRSARVSDAEDLLRYLKITSGETPYLIREPDEITLTVEEEEAYIRKTEGAERELLLIAAVNGRHIGNCSLTAEGSFRRYAHRCGVAIALYQEYCGRGIGRTMLETVLETAKACGYEQAELEAAVSNESAISLYQSLGFKIYGTFPRNMKYQDGTYEDCHWMMKIL